MSQTQVVREKGDVVEGYRVLAELGRGAASIVYLVQDPKNKQIWALKHVQKLTPKDQRFLDQAEAEYKIAGAVNHESVRKIPRLIKKSRALIQVRELYLVMEFVDGISLEQHKFGSVADALHTYHQVACGLASMHDAGWVHADMKPHNVILTETLDGRSVAKIIDMGQSCKVGTVKERIQGTPDYIAPEQVHRREITPKTDIYNLGASIYWQLSGTNIPTAMTGKNDSLVGSLDDHLLAKPTPLIELRPEAGDRLNELVMACVEASPDARPDSMHAVADRLELILGILRSREDGSAKKRPSSGGTAGGGSGDPAGSRTGMDKAAGG